MEQYNVIFDDIGSNEKTIIRGIGGTHGILQFAIIDENRSAVALTGLDTVAKIYVGTEGSFQINGTALTSVTTATGKATFALDYTTHFADNDDVGTFKVELYFADNASPTKIIAAGNCYLTVLPSLED